MVFADPPPSMEEEFNDWYDNEHLPERARLEGCLRARRFVSLGDGPAYLAAYDLNSLKVLESAAYRAISGDHFSPWTRRVSSRMRPARITARQVWSTSSQDVSAARLSVLRLQGVNNSDLERIGREFTDHLLPHGLLRLRLFAGVEPTPGSFLVLAEFNGVGGLPEMASNQAQLYCPDFVASYRPYRF